MTILQYDPADFVRLNQFVAKSLSHQETPMIVNLPVKLLTKTAKLPTRANPTDAGLDLYADIPATIRLMPHDWILIPTGIAVAMNDNECGQIWPRSGLAAKFAIDVLAGLIDPGYRGEIQVCLINKGMDCYHFEPGDKIAQLVIVPFNKLTPVVVDKLPEADRGGNGFGSSGQ